MSKTLCSVRKTTQKCTDRFVRSPVKLAFTDWLCTEKFITISSSSVSNDVVHRNCLKPIASPIWLAASSCWECTMILQLTSYRLQMKKCLGLLLNHHSTRRMTRYTHQRNQEASLWSQQSATHALGIQQVGYGVHCRVKNGYDWLNWYLLTLGWRWTASITTVYICAKRKYSQRIAFVVSATCGFPYIGH